MKASTTHAYRTRGGIDIYRASTGVEYADATAELVTALDTRPGVLLSSSYEFPGRYTRWDIGFTNPPLRICARGRRMTLEALNERGAVLLAICKDLVVRDDDLTDIEAAARSLTFTIRPPDPVLIEEERTRQRNVFSFLRNLIACFSSPEDGFLGLYGAFG